MLKPIYQEKEDVVVYTTLKDANVDNLFSSGLEYGCPARGCWNIVHTGFLIPESHQVFVCASNCLRGVVLTAAEMGYNSRFSTVTIKENNVLNGDMENLLIDGVTSILHNLKIKPKAVLVYTSCIHHFMALDMDLCYSTLRKRFKNIKFTDCYMNPIMRKSGMTPDEIMRKQLYSLIDNNNKKDDYVNICGNNVATDESSDLIKLIKKSKYGIRDITLCKNFKEYLDMGKSKFNISYLPVAKKGVDEFSKRLNIDNVYIPVSYQVDVIKQNLQTLANKLSISVDKINYADDEAVDKLVEAKKIIGDTPISIDYTFTPALFSLVKLLLDYSFNVKKIYTDSVQEKDLFKEIQTKYRDKDIKIYPTTNVAMRCNEREQGEKYLAIGQKAAYFTNTNNFINEVECGGHYGFDSIKQLANNMIDAYQKEKDASDLIQKKGLGCSCLL